MRTRMTRSRELGTGISRAHRSGTWSKPRLRAATAGNSASRSSVRVKMQLTTSSGRSSLRFMISRMSHSVAPVMASASFRSTVVAPRRAWSLAIGLAACQIALLASGCGGGGESVSAPPKVPKAIVLRAPFANGTTIPTRYTCSGAGERPRLVVSGVPRGRRGTRELVLVVTDPDAPNGTFVHWTAYAIPPDRRVLPGPAREGRNSAGGTGWTPPCPPKGDKPHRYVFSVYALHTPIFIKRGADPDAVIGVLNGAVARGRTVGRFGR